MTARSTPFPASAQSIVDQALALAPLIDGHNDWAWECRQNRAYSVEGLDGALDTDTDIQRLRTGRVGGQFWSVYVEDTLTGADAVQGTLEQVDWVYRLAAQYPETFQIVTSAAGVEAARAGGRIASLLGAEVRTASTIRRPCCGCSPASGCATSPSPTCTTPAGPTPAPTNQSTTGSAPVAWNTSGSSTGWAC